MHTCSVCHKVFVILDNLKRHRLVHMDNESGAELVMDSDNKTTETNAGDSDHESQHASDHDPAEHDPGYDSGYDSGNDSGYDSGNDSGNDSDNDTVDELPLRHYFKKLAWTPTLLATFRRKRAHCLEDGMAWHVAQQVAYHTVITRLRKNVLKVYRQQLILADRLCTDPVHKQIKAIKRSLKVNDDFGEDDVSLYPIQKQRYLIQTAADTLSDSELADSFEHGEKRL